ncbi:TadE/TadG family type IV pilus assembly protein [Paenibacillus lutimineralis]|uniref:TadE/TadG family type IV pilus assembly protein n=1 Tax=Paenibacillus lutimineralis TaxID=2707005 RepID=UPI001D0376D3|nr:hypothetical protein [Paenibacillus lutimineralis]
MITFPKEGKQVYKKQRHRAESGAVTVFLVVIFASVFAFVSIFIDFARMAALQTKTEMLAHSASRSVLSSYDPQLVEQYGLFAFGDTDANYIMSKVLQDQMDISKRSDDIPLMNARLDSSTVELLRPLGTYEVFEQQIREEMKYKAPIDFSIEIINRFKPMSKVMKEASSTVDLLSKLQKLYDQREAKLDEMLEKQRAAALTVTEIAAFIPRSSASGGSNGAGATASSVAGEYADFAAKYNEDMLREPEERQYSYEIQMYQSMASGVFNSLGRSGQKSSERHAVLLPEAKKLLQEVIVINDQMKRTIEEAEQRPVLDGYNEVAAHEGLGNNETVAADDEIAAIRKQSGSLLLSAELLADLEGDIGQQEADFTSFYAGVGSFLGIESSVLSASISDSSLYSAVDSLDRSTGAYLRKYVDSGSSNVLEDNKRRLEQHRSSDQERKTIEHQAETALQDAKGLIGKISALKDKFKDAQKQFDELQTFYNDNLEFNQSLSSGEEALMGPGDDPADAGAEAMGGMDVFFGGLSLVLQSMTDAAFQGEYVVHYFPLLDISTLDELIGSEGSGAIDTIGDSFMPGKQEVEYILYGFHNPTGNIAAAYGEIFALRLAIRTMEGLLKNLNKGNPLLILAAALLYGIEHAVKDMLMLTKEGSIQLSDFMKVKLTYRDHLRIFLLMHGPSERRLSRMLGLIRMNTGVPVEQRATYLKGGVSISMPLWFLPGVARTLGASGALKGRVEGSRYYVDKQTDFSY